MRYINIAIFVAFAALAFFAHAASASTIERSFSTNYPAPGGIVIVYLSVNITQGETFYLIDERVPAGWTVLGSGSGDSNDKGHVKWAVISGASDTTYSYQVMVPNTEGTYSFSGQYMFEGMTSEGTIGGSRSVAVTAPGLEDQKNEAMTDIALFVLVVAVLALALFGYRKMVTAGHAAEGKKSKKGKKWKR